MTHPPEAHRLGPHVVGQRVVVRRVLRGQTGPSGGPAMTDLLGICTAWGEDGCVIQPEDGAPVEIALADIVSGKPVPPRPSVRHRVSPVAAQHHAFALFPDLELEPLGDWMLRSSVTSPARRANSVLAFGPAGLEDAFERVVAHYPRPIAAVLPDSPEDALFRSHGWGLESHDADTLFQLAGVAQVARALGAGGRAASASEPGGRAASASEPGGRAASASEPGGRAASASERRRDPEVELVETAPGVVTARIGDVASGVAAYADDWVGFRSLEVAPTHRRQGLALAVMAELVDWGAAQGARTAYLQVIGDNQPALDLYAGLGFRTHHAYRYLAPEKDFRMPR